MEQSIFIKFIQKYFPGVVVSIVDTINDSKQPLTYLHRTMLKPTYSIDGNWNAVSTGNTRVAADIVALDSSIPLKKRDAITKASGELPKVAMELKLSEKQLEDLDKLVRLGASETAILAKLFEDTPKVISGIYERNEAIFLQALSTGIAQVDNDKNVGTGIRVDYGYYTANKFGVSILPTLANVDTAKPFDDIQRLLDKVALDGNVIKKALLDSTTLNAIAATKQAKELFAFNSGFTGGNVPAPSLEQLNQLTSTRYGFVFQKVDRSIRIEKNGVQTAYKPWAAGQIVFITDDNVGSLVYGDLAEANHKVAGVEYQTADSYILVSKYRENKPSLSEITCSQAKVLPVIANVDRIYVLDTLTVQA